MKRLLVCGFALCAFSSAAMADEYWVVQDAHTKHCSVVTEKPTTTTTTVIGNTAFTTKSEAENSIKTTKVCSSD